MPLFPTWSDFILQHPDRDNLDTISADLVNLINPTASAIENTHSILSTKSTIILTLDPFTTDPSPLFHHDQLGIPLPNQNSHLIALHGFSTSAQPILVSPAIFTFLSPDPIPCPSLEDLMSFAVREPDDIKDLTPTPNTHHRIPAAAVLPPSIANFLITTKTTYSWNILYNATVFVYNQGPAEAPDEDADPLEYARPFYNFLLTLWSFTRSTPELASLAHPARGIASSQAAKDWAERAHAANIRSVTPPSTPPTPQSNDSIAAGINRLARSLEDQQNDRYATSDETKQDDDSSKLWRKLEPMYKQVILFSSSTDGENPQTQPTTRLLALLGAKNGANAARLFKSWHSQDIVVQTGMATNIAKGCLVSSDGPFSINTFSPFFTPPQRAGFNILSHDELNSLDFLSASNNLKHNDIQKMVQAKPYIPSSPHLFIAQLQNFHAVITDVLRDDSLTSRIVSDAIDHFNNNELLYYNTFNNDPDFPVWFLNQLHFKIQQIFHHASKANAVTDIPFHHFTMDAELQGISTQTYHSKIPLWYTKLKQQQQQQQQTDNRRNPHHQPSPYSTPSSSPKRRTISNPSPDHITKIRPGETYSSIIQNTKNHTNSEVTLDGNTICNNWHIRGWCTDGCRRSSSHLNLQGELLRQYRNYVNKIRNTTINHEPHKSHKRRPNTKAKPNTESSPNPSTPDETPITP